MSLLLNIGALTSFTGVSAFDGDNGVYASDQENASYECEVAAINEELGNGGGKKEEEESKSAVR